MTDSYHNDSREFPSPPPCSLGAVVTYVASRLALADNLLALEAIEVDTSGLGDCDAVAGGVAR